MLFLGGVLLAVIGIPVAGSSVDAANLIIGIVAISLILAVALWLFAGVGLSPLFDPATGRYRPPADRREAGLRTLAIGAATAITVGMLGIGVPLIANELGASFDDDDVPLIGTIVIVTIVGGLALAGIAGGIVVLGVAGVFAGLVLAGGVYVSALGVVRADGGLLALGMVGIAVAVGFYFAGARAHGIPFDQIGLRLPVGAALAYGAVLLVIAVAVGDVQLLVAGVGAVASAVGWLVGGLLARRGANASEMPTSARSTPS